MVGSMIDSIAGSMVASTEGVVSDMIKTSIYTS
jgi:hypothetical protein